MVSGAVIIGQDLTLVNFQEMKERVRFPLVTICPLEVAYPKCLANPKSWRYREGILVYAFGGEGEEIRFEEELEKTLLQVGNDLETAYCDSRMGRTTSWDSRLSYQQIVSDGEIRKPYMQVLKIFQKSDRESLQDYQRIARSLVDRTYKARIRNFQLFQKDRRTRALDRIDEVKTFQ
jgi:hypothetical protein